MSADNEHKELLRGMKVGDSFFLDGVKPSSLKKIRRIAYSIGRRVSIRWVIQDEIYGTSGTRVFLTSIDEQADKK